MDEQGKQERIGGDTIMVDMLIAQNGHVLYRELAEAINKKMGLTENHKFSIKDAGEFARFYGLRTEREKSGWAIVASAEEIEKLKIKVPRSKATNLVKAHIHGTKRSFCAAIRQNGLAETYGWVGLGWVDLFVHWYLDWAFLECP